MVTQVHQGLALPLMLLLLKLERQVVVGSFIAEGKKPKPEPLRWEPSSAPPQMPGFGAAVTASPPSEGTSSESSEDPGSPTNQSGGTCHNSSQHVQPAYPPVSWSHSANLNGMNLT
ncbi:hypothetical protein GW17_00032673 [Ensete ventricosum]|nr:hypothetical protein GW17_00032673 [Ensete ventricosum]